MNTQEIAGTNPALRVGSSVLFLFGRERLKGVVIEDRGAIGAGGRRLFRISVPLDSEDPLVLELPAEQLQLA